MKGEVDSQHWHAAACATQPQRSSFCKAPATWLEDTSQLPPSAFPQATVKSLWHALGKQHAPPQLPTPWHSSLHMSAFTFDYGCINTGLGHLALYQHRKPALTTASIFTCRLCHLARGPSSSHKSSSVQRLRRLRSPLPLPLAPPVPPPRPVPFLELRRGHKTKRKKDKLPLWG